MEQPKGNPFVSDVTDPEEPIKKWNSETGKKVGFAFAERFLRITLKEPEVEAEAGSANE